MLSDLSRTTSEFNPEETCTGLTQTGDESPYYKQIHFRKNVCFSKVGRFVVAQFIAPCVSPVVIYPQIV